MAPWNESRSGLRTLVSSCTEALCSARTVHAHLAWRGDARADKTEQWFDLCRLASIEQDPDKVFALINQINDTGKALLSSEPICYSFWTKSNGGANFEGRDSSSLRILINRYRRKCQECGELFGLRRLSNLIWRSIRFRQSSPRKSSSTGVSARRAKRLACAPAYLRTPRASSLLTRGSGARKSLVTEKLSLSANC
jgi:hypothetical protein